MLHIDDRLINLIERLINSNSIKDKYSLILEFAIDNETIDKEQIKELVSFTKNLVDEKIAVGKNNQKMRSNFTRNENLPIKTEIPEQKPTKSNKKYSRVELFNDNKKNNLTCVSCGKVIVGSWIFKHNIGGEYQCWHPESKCIPIKRLTEFITRPKYRQFLEENRVEDIDSEYAGEESSDDQIE